MYFLGQRKYEVYCCSVTNWCLTLCDLRTTACQTPLSFTVSWSFLKFISTETRCHLTISSSATPFSFWLQSFPASGSFCCLCSALLDWSDILCDAVVRDGVIGLNCFFVFCSIFLFKIFLSISFFPFGFFYFSFLPLHPFLLLFYSFSYFLSLLSPVLP